MRTPAPAPRSRLVTVALVLAVLGTAAIVVAFAWYYLAGSPPFTMYLLALLLPAGMLVAAVGVARDYRTPR